MSDRFHILVVEDDADLRDIFVTVLAESGYDASAVVTHAEAVSMLARQDVSLVLADYRPELATQGVLWEELDRVVRAAAPGKVGLIAGWKLDAEEIARRGFAFVLPIPCDIAALLGTVVEHVQARSIGAAEERAIHAYFDALTRKDWEALAAVCAEGVVYNVPGNDPRFSQTVVGRDAFKRFAAETFAHFPDAVFTVDAVLGLPTATIARWRARFTGPTGAAIENGGAIWFRFDGELIASIGIRMDLQRLLDSLRSEV